MRPLFVISFIFLLGSCAHNRIRLVKTSRPVVVKVEEKNRPERIYKANEEMAEAQLLTPQEVTTTDDFVADDEEVVTPATATTYSSNPAPQDSTTNSDVDKTAILQALDAEDNAKSAKRLFMASLITFWIPIVSLTSFIPFLIGLVMLGRANRSRYITEEGETISFIARILRNLYLVKVIVFVLLMLALLFVF